MIITALENGFSARWIHDHYGVGWERIAKIRKALKPILNDQSDATQIATDINDETDDEEEEEAPPTLTTIRELVPEVFEYILTQRNWARKHHRRFQTECLTRMLLRMDEVV